MSNGARPRAVSLAVLLALLCLSVSSYAQIPSPSRDPTAQPSPTITAPQVLGPPLSLDEALGLANAQVSSFQNASINERIAGEDLRQAQAAFLPKVSAPLGYIYTSPALGLPPGQPREPSFVSADGIGVYDALVNASGDFDIAGRLRATVAKNSALLAAARAGTEAARRALAQSVIENYYGLALANAQRRAAEGNLSAAEEFENITSLLLSGGEVAAVDLTRAKLQTLTRRDELEKARVNEQVAAGALRVLVGYEFSRPITAADLELTLPVALQYHQFKVEDVPRRPEFIQFEQQVAAARQEIKIARADRLPSLSYSISGGFNTDSIKPTRLKEHAGVSASISLSIPMFDWGATRSRERQAKLRVQLAENERTLALRGFTEQFYAARALAGSAAARIGIAREGVVKAQDNLAASIARYRAGEAQ